MDTIGTSLQKLDELYHTDTVAEYEKIWQRAAKQIQQEFPDFTLAYAEISNASQERLAHGGMRHVLLLKEIGVGCETV